MNALVLAALLLGAPAAVAATATKEAPPAIPPGSTIAVAPPWFELFELDPARSKLVTDIIESDLEARGYKVVSAGRVGEVWLAKAREIGGYFDPYSGERIAEKYRMVHDHTWNVLSAEQPIAALYFPRIVVAEAAAGENFAEWDGLKIQLRSIWTMTAGTSQRAVPALTLVADVRDQADQPLFAARGGIEMMVVYKDRKFSDVPREELLQKVATVEKAVELTNGQLAPKAER